MNQKPVLEHIVWRLVTPHMQSRAMMRLGAMIKAILVEVEANLSVVPVDWLAQSNAVFAFCNLLNINAVGDKIRRY